MNVRGFTIAGARPSMQDTKLTKPPRAKLEKLFALAKFGSTSSKRNVKLVPLICCSRMRVIATLINKIWGRLDVPIFVRKSSSFRIQKTQLCGTLLRPRLQIFWLKKMANGSWIGNFFVG